MHASTSRTSSVEAPLRRRLKWAVHELPRGTVTLLFADIEGSTRLVAELGDRYLPVLEEYRNLVRAEVERANGVEIDCKGDEIFIAFSDAAGAVEAAAAIQKELAQPAAPLRTRIGIHTGTPGVAAGRDGYFGLDVHRAARISSAAHGGQVIMSEGTRRHLGESEYTLLDLGPHNLRGLPRPERLFQLVPEGLPADFPPLRYVENYAVAEDDPSRMRVAIGEDSLLLREGIVRLLGESGFQVVGQAGDAEELLLEIRRASPDVAIVDIRMPPSHTDEGIRAARQIRREHADTSVLVLSQYAEPAYALELLEGGSAGVGYLLKDRVSDVLDFAGAVRRVGEGGCALDPEVVSLLVRRARGRLAGLSELELEVLELMVEGRSEQEISDRLVIEVAELERRVSAVLDHLDVAEAPEEERRAELLATLTRPA
jgi:class 3 adenylate cyclase/DNA-binding NarL/FixJ family response regulator